MGSIKGIFIFVILSLGFYFVMMFALSKVSYNGSSMIVQTNDFYYLKGGDTYQKFYDFKKDNFYNIVFVGSSRSYRHYNPDFFAPEHLVSWNLGTSSQTLNNSKIIIENYLSGKNCEVVVLDLFPAAFNTAGLESSSDLIANITENNVALQIGWEMKDSRSLNLLVRRYLTQDRPPSFTEEDYLGKGFCAHVDSIKKKVPLIDDQKIEDLQINEQQLEKLEEIILYCQASQIQLVLCISPTSGFFPEKTYQQFKKIIEPMIKKYKVPFYDYAKSLGLTKDHFYDDSHMNIEGVKIFNKTFYEDLKKANFVK